MALESNWVHVEVITEITPGLEDTDLTSLTGIARNGAVLLRPDGIVFWRFKEPDMVNKARKDPVRFVKQLLRIENGREGLVKI